MAVMTKGARGTAVKQSTLVDAHSALQSLPEKQKEELSLKQAVAKLKAPLQAALAKGYSYPELAVILKDNGIVISAATLKNYVPVGKRSGKRLSKGTKSQSDVADLGQTDTSDEDIAGQSSTKTRGKASQSTEAASAKQRGGRGKAKTTTEATTSSDESESSTAKPASSRRSSAAKTRTSSKQSTAGKAKPSPSPRTKSTRTRK